MLTNDIDINSVEYKYIYLYYSRIFLIISGSLQFIETPFKLYRLTNVFSNEGVLELKQELENLKFSDRMTDMYSFSQTEDLFNLKNKNKKTCISKFLQFLEYFRTLLSKKYNLILNSKISVSCSRYSYGGRDTHILFFLKLLNYIQISTFFLIYSYHIQIIYFAMMISVKIDISLLFFI